MEHIKFKASKKTKQMSPMPTDGGPHSRVCTHLTCLHTLDTSAQPNIDMVGKGQALTFSAQDGIEGYDKTKLSHTQTMEKNTLPTKEVIALEKSQ